MIGFICYRAKAAVDAERVYAQTFEHGNRPNPPCRR